MSTFVGLNSRVTTAALDTTGLNPGNYTNAFTAGALGINVPYYECFHIVVTNVPPAQYAKIYIGARQWGFTSPANQGTEWAPPWGMYLTPEEEIYFFWNFNSTLSGATTPVITCWFRYDLDIPANKTYQ